MTIIPAALEPLLPQMQDHARSVMPLEACGLVVSGSYVQCTNVHPDPENHFTIDPRDYAAASEQGEIEAIFHSHVDFTDEFSPHDIKSCKGSNLPWVLYSVAANAWAYADPTGNAPYLGRPWNYGIYDCYALIRDFYKREFGIVLDDYERGAEFEWDNPEWRMFEKNFKAQGFVDIGEPSRKGDILLMQLQAPFANHVGVIVEPDKNIFYQHLLDRLSEANIFGGYWEKHSNRFLRHRSLV